MVRPLSRILDPATNDFQSGENGLRPAPRCIPRRLTDDSVAESQSRAVVRSPLLPALGWRDNPRRAWFYECFWEHRVVARTRPHARQFLVQAGCLAGRRKTAAR